MTPTQPDPEPQMIDFREFLSVVRRRWLSIALVTLLVVGVALSLVYRRSPEYSSTARVEVRPLMAGADLQGSYFDLVSNMSTESQRVTSRDVATRAAVMLGVADEGSELTADQLEAVTDDVSTSIPANTTYIDITCTMLARADAQACADAFAVAYVDDRREIARDSADAAREGPEKAIAASERRIKEFEARLAATDDPGARADLRDRIDTEERAIDTARLQLLAAPTASPDPAGVSLPASEPMEPSNKDYVTTGVLAGIVGIALGIGLAFVRERLDERIGRRESLESALGAPVLAVVPRVSSWRNHSDSRLVTIDAPDTVAAEAYRTARTTLMYAASREDIKVIVVTAPGEGDGKTTTTANLGVALAQAGKRVVVVSADLRKPRLHRFFQVGDHAGLTEVLQGHATLRQAIFSTMLPNLKVVSSGTIAPNPAELLASTTMDAVIASLRSSADFVLIDTPPSLVVADALELAPKTDGIVIVVDGSKTTRQVAIHLRHQLERVGGLIVGGILNNLDPGQEAPYGRYYRSMDSSYRKPTRKARKQHARTASRVEPEPEEPEPEEPEPEEPEPEVPEPRGPEEFDWQLSDDRPEVSDEVVNVPTPEGTEARAPSGEAPPNGEIEPDRPRPQPDVAEWR